MTQKHFEDQARKTRDEDYGHNIPFPADHSGECNDAGEDGERIDRSRAWKDHVQAEQTARFSTTPTTAGVTAESIRLKFVALQIGVMDQFGQPLRRAVSNREAIDRCLERAMVAVMTELDIEHVVRDGRPTRPQKRI
jgi:hypothetical protein